MIRAFLRAHLEATARGEALPPFVQPARAMAVGEERARAPGVVLEDLGAARQDMLVFSPPENWTAPAARARAVVLDETLPVGGRSRLPKDAVAYGVRENGAFVAWAAAAPMGGIAHITAETQPAHRGRGLATACLIALTHALQAEGRTAVYVCDRGNVASQKVAAGAGYVLCEAWKRW